MNPVLREALAAAVPDVQRHCRDRWIVIGSTTILLAALLPPDR